MPVIGPSLGRLNRWLDAKSFENSSKYWEERYKTGGNSGPGSYGRLAQFKAEVVNDIVASRDISTIAEFGCGDGNQLRMAAYPHYTGFDVSDTILETCRKTFNDYPKYVFKNVRDFSAEKYDLAMSLDVIFHLVEDGIFHEYMTRLFDAAGKYVLIYASDFDDAGEFGVHVKNRDFKPWIAKNRSDFHLEQRIPNAFPFNGDHETTSFCDFFLYARN
jgi:cyclopropane fatty-acyl-phospholipid synthase-like methyltransferase